MLVVNYNLMEIVVRVLLEKTERFVGGTVRTGSTSMTTKVDPYFFMTALEDCLRLHLKILSIV